MFLDVVIMNNIAKITILDFIQNIWLRLFLLFFLTLFPLVFSIRITFLHLYLRLTALVKSKNPTKIQFRYLSNVTFVSRPRKGFKFDLSTDVY